MLHVSVELFRKHSAVTSDNDDDIYLAHLLKTAQQAVESDINHSLSSYEEDGGEIPIALIHAIILYAANLYENRETVAYGLATARPYNYSALISPYIKLT